MNFDSLIHAATHFAHMAVEMIEAETHVGSNDPKIERLEFGTSKMPPRPVFLSAAKAALPQKTKVAF